MAEPLDAYQYLGYLASRWRLLAAVCAVAVCGSLAVSLLMPRRFTATSRILIEPAAGMDPRSAMSVSPIYLESLKTYEQFASSDSLFARAVARFQLRDKLGRGPVESLKRSILRVSIPRNTKILEVQVTLTDAVVAQAVAEYLAGEAVKMNRTLLEESDRDLVRSAEKQLAEAQASVDAADAAWMRSLADGAAGGVEAPLRRGGQPRTEKDARQLMLEDRREMALSALARAERRLEEARGTMGYRGERLAMIDPGIVPERPSSPNLPLSVLAALVMGLAGAWLWVTVAFGHPRR